MPIGTPIDAEEAVRLKALIIENLEDAVGGTFMEACRLANVGRSTAYEWREIDTEFDLKISAAMRRTKETLKDSAESSLARRVAADDPWAVKYVLTMLGKDRGYAPKVINEHVGKNGGAIELKRTFGSEEEAQAVYERVRKL